MELSYPVCVLVIYVFCLVHMAMVRIFFPRSWGILVLFPFLMLPFWGRVVYVTTHACSPLFTALSLWYWPTTTIVICSILEVLSLFVIIGLSKEAH